MNDVELLLVRALPRPEPGPDLAARLLDRILSSQEDPHELPHNRRLYFVGGAFAGAAALAAVIGVRLTRSRRSGRAA
ncbi:MAG TPA: hypothetical protein VNE62_04620 [Actinomycetota bacterium]|nr:hypothetical protein [Actinomycetota bacterium]